MYFLYLILLFLLFIILAPAIAAFLVIYLGLGFLDLSAGGMLLILLVMLITSFINIPLTRKRFVRVVETSFFGALKRVVWRAQGVSINVGGALIPLLIVGYFLPELPLKELFITTGVVAFFSFLGARFIEKRGIMIPMLLPVLFAVIFSLMLAPEQAAEVAFSAGVLGVIIGADLLHLPWIMRKRGGVMSIGGAGIFDGILLVGVVSALLTGL